jgi:hypothetical protein
MLVFQICITDGCTLVWYFQQNDQSFSLCNIDITAICKKNVIPVTGLGGL